MRICFIGNAFHKRTRSHAFFLDIIERIGDVTSLYVDTDGGTRAYDGVVRALLAHRFDCTIFWQTDRLAQQLIPLGLERCFLVPMYDSVHDRGPDYWQSLIGHHVLSFSRRLHETVSAAHGRSSYFQYFPEPGTVPDRDFEHPEGFFWERRPGLPLNFDRIATQARMLGLSHLHVHAVADYAHEGRADLAAATAGPALSVSTWYERYEDFAEAASRPLFFFAPRPMEGIGMATLEAMARGQIVVAPDLSTTNEYVAHLTSGLLYPSHAEETALPRLEAAALRAMSAAAHRKIVEGRRTWLMDVERLISILKHEDRRWPTGDHSSHFAARIRRAAHERVAHVG